MIGLVGALCAVASLGYILVKSGAAASFITTLRAEVDQLTGGAGRPEDRDGASGGNAMPVFKVDVMTAGRSHAWDVAVLPANEILFTERAGTLSVLRNGSVRQVASIEGVDAGGEGGLLGLALDPQFSQNRYLYLCFNSTAGDVRLARWVLAADLSGLSGRKDIITGITANQSGRHSGCRMAFGPDGYLWVGTGDAALGTHSQQPRSLNGKILRVDRNGVAAPGNLGSEFEPRIYSYGHRNTQGLAFFKSAKNGVAGLSAEHGSTADDEVNELRKGNFGWAPPQGYDESGVSMTDKQRFPDAVDAIWSSGSPSQAPSGMAIISGSRWQGWDGAAAVAMLRARHLKILHLDASNKVIKEERVLENAYGRLRTVVQAPDGNLYVTTDNGSNDKILKLTPQ